MVIDTARPHHTPPFYNRHTRDNEAPLPRRKWGLVDLRPVESVGSGEAVQQSARIGARLLVVNRDDGDLEDGVSEMR